MPGSLGTLVTTITADASGFTSTFDTAAKHAEKFERQTTSVLANVKSKMESFKDSLRGLRDFTELGFGIGIGRHVFEKIHEGFAKAFEGFAKAREDGEGIGDSLSDALKNAVGLTTKFAEMAAYAEKIKGLRGLGAGADEKGEAALRLAGIGEDRVADFPFLKNGTEIQSKLDGYVKDLKAINEKARPFREQIEAARTAIASGIVGGIATTPFEDLAKAQKEGGPFFVEQDRIAGELREYREKLARANNEASFQKGRDKLFGPFSDAKAALEKKLGFGIPDLQSAGLAAGALGDMAAGRLGGLIGAVDRMAFGGIKSLIDGGAGPAAAAHAHFESPVDVWKQIQLAAASQSPSTKPATAEDAAKIKKAVEDGTTAVVNAVKALAAAGGFAFG